MKALTLLGILVIVVFAASLFPNAIGQPSLLVGKISGTVTDAVSRQPIENATVTAGIGSFINQTATTNSTGQYFITNLAGNLTGITYNVTASRVGYNASTANVTLTTVIDFLPPATQNFTLTPSPTPTVSPSSTPTASASSTSTGTLTPTPTIPELSLIAVVTIIAFATLMLTKMKAYWKN